MSRFFLHVMSAFAEMEVSLIRERTIAGVRAARANGKTLGDSVAKSGQCRAIDVVLHHGRPAHPDRPDNLSVHLNGKPATPRRHTRKRGDAGQKRRVALAGRRMGSL